MPTEKWRGEGEQLVKQKETAGAAEGNETSGEEGR